MTVYCQVGKDRCACRVSICTTYVTSVYWVQLVKGVLVSLRQNVEGFCERTSVDASLISFAAKVHGDWNDA